MVITPVSLRLWKSSGRISAHSIDVGMCALQRMVRWAANASHRMKMNINSAVNESSEPKDEITFHFISASG